MRLITSVGEKEGWATERERGEMRGGEGRGKSKKVGGNEGGRREVRKERRKESV